ncbi:MAG: glycosyltransferase [Planctomycetota bacterium]
MDALLLAPEHERHRPDLGPSFEDATFGDALRALGWRVEVFDDVAQTRRLGVEGMNRRLAERVAAEKPDLLFAVLRRPLVDRRTIRRITQSGLTKTFNWYCDDHWQFRVVSRRWTPCFGLVGTTSAMAVGWYQARGWDNVLKTQWAADPAVFRPEPAPPKCDVAFVGQPYGERASAIQTLRHAGIDAQGFGPGWASGRLSTRAMVSAMARAKIVLNFSGSSVRGFSWADRLLLGRTPERLMRTRGGWRAVDALRKAAASVRAGGMAKPGPAQIKARVFEATACGACLVTQTAEDFADLYTPGIEAVLFRDADELLWACRSLLDDETRRATIAAAGRSRLLAEHTWSHRMADVFDRLGLDAAARSARIQAKQQAESAVRTGREAA